MGAMCISPCMDVGGVLYPPRTPSHPNSAFPGHQQSPAQVPGLQGGGDGGWGQSKRGSLKGDGEGTPGHALQTRAGRRAQDASRGTARALLRPTWQEESCCPGGRGRTAAATVAASSGQPSSQAARPGPAAAPRAARRAGPLNPREPRPANAANERAGAGRGWWRRRGAGGSSEGGAGKLRGAGRWRTPVRTTLVLAPFRSWVLYPLNVRIQRSSGLLRTNF